MDFSLSCPLPLQNYAHVLLAHGGGGRLMHQLIEEMFLSTFGSKDRIQHDAVTLQLSGNRIAFTTDSYVVQPLFFPGGDIGSLAVNGTVNDLAMAGARPLFLSLSFILEAGLSMATLWQVVQSIQQAASQAGVQIVTGDTKVVESGKGDGLYINTTGIGLIEHDLTIFPTAVQPGDVVLINGDIGRHGIAVMAIRQGIEFDEKIVSDSAPLAGPVLALLEAGIEIHCLRDLTRGGLASALNEIAKAAKVTIFIEEDQIPLREAVRGACEILGLDPLHIANEGRFVAFVPEIARDRALSCLKSYQATRGETPAARIIGTVKPAAQLRGGAFPGVVLENSLGTSRLLEMLSGEQLPRIC